MTKRKSPEADIQRAVFQHIRMRGISGARFWHTPNGGSRNKAEAARLKGMGVEKGVSDVLAFHKGRLFAMEIKAPGGRPTKEQLAFLGDLDREGAFTAMPEGLDAALATLEAWGLLVGSTAKDVLRIASERMEARA